RVVALGEGWGVEGETGGGFGGARGKRGDGFTGRVEELDAEGRAVALGVGDGQVDAGVDARGAVLGDPVRGARGREDDRRRDTDFAVVVKGGTLVVVQVDGGDEFLFAAFGDVDGDLDALLRVAGEADGEFGGFGGERDED